MEARRHQIRKIAGTREGSGGAYFADESRSFSIGRSKKVSNLWIVNLRTASAPGHPEQNALIRLQLVAQRQTHCLYMGSRDPDSLTDPFNQETEAFDGARFNGNNPIVLLSAKTGGTVPSISHSGIMLKCRCRRPGVAAEREKDQGNPGRVLKICIPAETIASRRVFLFIALADSACIGLASKSSSRSSACSGCW